MNVPNDSLKYNLMHMEDEEKLFSEADYEAVKAIAIRNCGVITNDEIFSVTVRGYLKLAKIKDKLILEGIIEPEQS